MQAPPTYSAQDSGLPIYAEAPATGERVLALGGLARSDSTSEYRYAFGRLVLNLGPKIYSTTVPVYGKNSLIEGYVEVKKFSHVRKVVVSVSALQSFSTARKDDRERTHPDFWRSIHDDDAARRD
jgi:hypothetical protein